MEEHGIIYLQKRRGETYEMVDCIGYPWFKILL